MTKPKVVEMKVVFLVEDEEKLLSSFDPIRERMEADTPRSLAHAAMPLTDLKAPPGTTELRVFFQSGSLEEYEDGDYWLQTPGVCVVRERREAKAVRVVKVTSALVIEDEKLLHRVAEWTLNQRPHVEHGYKLVDDDGQIDVTECLMALYTPELPPGVSGPMDAYDIREFPIDLANRPGFDFIRAFEEPGYAQAFEDRSQT